MNIFQHWFRSQNSARNYTPIDFTESSVAKSSSSTPAATSALLALVCAQLLNGALLSGAPLQAQESGTAELEQLSIEQLINLEVTSVSKKVQKLSDSAAAVFVLTEEDIRRSGYTSIPDVLRLVPGLDVARIDGSQWSISARGFNAVFGDKLLVLIDGRSVYTPLFGGVFWNEIDTLLSDIERIEVIRGPGATLWGANATNGVINIITKSAARTHGNVFTAGGGSEERYFASLRHGGKENDTNYRVYAKYYDRDANSLTSGAQAHDDWRAVTTGFRTDTQLSSQDLFTFQGDSRYGESGWDFQAPSLETLVSAGDDVRYHNTQNLLGRWTRTLSDESDFSLQMYYDRVDRNDGPLQQLRNLVDLDFQHRIQVAESHELLYGAGYRYYYDEMQGSFAVDVIPESRSIDLFTGFLQDEITLLDDLKLIVGSKVEHNDHSGFEVQPNVRIISTPAENQTFWGAISRAIRSPARFNHDGKLVLGVQPPNEQVPLPQVFTLNGTRDYDSSILVAYEIGYRGQLARNLSLDISTFYNDYQSLQTAEPGGAPFVSDRYGTYVEVPLIVENKMEGYTYGGEVALDLRPFDWWRLVASYAALEINLVATQDSQDFIYSAAEKQSPNHQAMLRSQIDLPYNTEFDATLRYISELDAFDIDSYTELDLRFGWQMTEDIELAAVGQNLLDSDHEEFSSTLVDTQRTAIDRGVYGYVTWRF
jgi:iron complex outermembrane receptor protein